MIGVNMFGEVYALWFHNRPVCPPHTLLKYGSPTLMTHFSDYYCKRYNTTQKPRRLLNRSPSDQNEHKTEIIWFQTQTNLWCPHIDRGKHRENTNKPTTKKNICLETISKTSSTCAELSVAFLLPADRDMEQPDLSIETCWILSKPQQHVRSATQIRLDKKVYIRSSLEAKKVERKI